MRNSDLMIKYRRSMFCMPYFIQTRLISLKRRALAAVDRWKAHRLVKPNQIRGSAILALAYAATRREVYTDGAHVGLTPWLSQSSQYGRHSRGPTHQEAQRSALESTRRDLWSRISRSAEHANDARMASLCLHGATLCPQATPPPSV